jgi:hypothetical protein
VQAVPIGDASSRPPSADHWPARQTAGVTKIVTQGTNYANAEPPFQPVLVKKLIGPIFPIL